MTVNAVRVRFLFIDGTTEAPRGVCMAAMAQAPKDEFSLLCKPGRPQADSAVLTSYLSWTLVSRKTMPPYLTSAAQRGCQQDWEFSIFISFYSISVFFYLDLGPLPAGQGVSDVLPSVLAILSIPPVPPPASSHNCSIHFFPCCPRQHQWSGRTTSQDTLMWPAASFPMEKP